jgi:hypothetical protein
MFNTSVRMGFEPRAAWAIRNPICGGDTMKNVTCGDTAFAASPALAGQVTIGETARR